MIFIQDESDTRTDIFRYKTVLSNKDYRYSCKNYAPKNLGGKTIQQAKYSLNSQKI